MSLARDSARDSSVLFALDELRCLEEERIGESARAAREQAKRALDREAEARRRRQHSEQQSAELLALRERAQVEEAQRTELAARLVEEGERRRALEGQLQRLTVEQHAARVLEPSAPPRRHPALWSTVLLAAGAIVFWLMPRQGASPPPPPVVAESAPVGIDAVATNCPDLAPVDPTPPMGSSLVEPAAAATATAPRGPRRIREKVPQQPAQATSSLPTDCAGKGPLCGMPED